MENASGSVVRREGQASLGAILSTCIIYSESTEGIARRFRQRQGCRESCCALCVIFFLFFSLSLEYVAILGHGERNRAGLFKNILKMNIL